MRRQSSNPKRRLASPDRLDPAGRQALAARLAYTGSALHKRRAADYGFNPPINPRAWKSLCDGKQVILKAEASELFRQGVLNGLFSDFQDVDKPKYVWTVDTNNEVYEAVVDTYGYHGYRLEEEDDFRTLIFKEWKRRCNPR
ncbi:hypothetical protein [Rhodopila sp.]|uniref:hypothetical protein n=1 Tax=Rhodopila sp. TaxID=2480087 RepID=UPI003D0B89B9